MSKGAQLWPGDRMRRFFLAHVQRVPGVDGDAAERIADALNSAVNRMWVWDADAEPSIATDRERVAEHLNGAVAALRVETIAPREEPAATQQPDATAPEPAQVAPAPAFNPYAFSALAALAKWGRDGLMKRLADISNTDNLIALAEAQHLAIDRNLENIDELRRAIVAATEQRLADRKAAAS